jgi:hypothetical protein
MFVLPKSIVILGERFKIKLVDAIGDKDSPDVIHATCDTTKRVIFLNKSIGQAAFETALLHEIIHAILAITGISAPMSESTEETLVSALERALFPIIQLKTRKRRS